MNRQKDTGRKNLVLNFVVEAVGVKIVKRKLRNRMKRKKTTVNLLKYLLKNYGRFLIKNQNLSVLIVR
jgi:hypothetical protein